MKMKMKRMDLLDTESQFSSWREAWRVSVQLALSHQGRRSSLRAALTVPSIRSTKSPQ
jgi:hypothetical protein